MPVRSLSTPVSEVWASLRFRAFPWPGLNATGDATRRSFRSCFERTYSFVSSEGASYRRDQVPSLENAPIRGQRWPVATVDVDVRSSIVASPSW